MNFELIQEFQMIFIFSIFNEQNLHFLILLYNY